jgi:hypothetical protein
MNKKVVIGFIIGLGVIVVLVAVSSKPQKSSETIGNVQDNQSTALNQQMQSFARAEKVEVFLFHATQRCPTCIRIGQLAKATVEERFSEQLKSGKIDFREINIDLPENKALAEKFQAVGSAFFINTIRDGQDNIEEDMTVWQLASGDPVKYKDYLSKKLNTILGI